MKTLFRATILTVLLIGTGWAAESASNLGNVRGGDIKEAKRVVARKCTTCHSVERIDAALKANQNMLQIQQKMEAKGVSLTAREREVLGIYWKQSPLKQPKQ